MSLDVSDLNTVFMPRQWLLKKLDPWGALIVTKGDPGIMMIEYKSHVVIDKFNGYWDQEENAHL